MLCIMSEGPAVSLRLLHAKISSQGAQFEEILLGIEFTLGGREHLRINSNTRAMILHFFSLIVLIDLY